MNPQKLLNTKFTKFCLLKKSDYEESNIYYVEIAPADIASISLYSSSSPWLTGPQAITGVYHGIFDFFKKPFHKHFMYLTAQKIVRGDDFRETAYYRKLEKGYGSAYAHQHIQKVFILMESLRKSGYRSQYELGNTEETTRIGLHTVPRNETIIGMDRYGKLFRLVGGRHRLALAQNMELDKMNAVLSLIHKNAKGKLPQKNRLIKKYPIDLRPL